MHNLNKAALEAATEAVSDIQNSMGIDDERIAQSAVLAYLTAARSTTPTDDQVEAAIKAFDEAIADGLSKPRALELALTAAFSLAAPAGTVEVSEDDKAAIREYATRGSPYRHATLAHSNFVVCVERIALAWIEEQRSAPLPPQPSAEDSKS